MLVSDLTLDHFLEVQTMAAQHKNAFISLIIGSTVLQFTVNLKETIGCESFGGVRFHLRSLLQGQTVATEHKSDCVSLSIDPRGLQCTVKL